MTVIVSFLGYICLAMFVTGHLQLCNFRAVQVSCSAYESICTW